MTKIGATSGRRSQGDYQAYDKINLLTFENCIPNIALFREQRM